MNIRDVRFKRLFVVMALVTGQVSFLRVPAAEESPASVSELAGNTHFHGIAVDPRDPGRLYLATHHGVFLVTPDGKATRISDNRNDYMGFTPDPGEPGTFFASGHPADGGNMGFIVSEDCGRSWRRLAEGVGGPVDFHQMDVSRSDPQVIYGVYGGLQVSRDGGRTWEMTADAPPELFDLAVSSIDSSRLYAATRAGLLMSEDSGETWQPAHYNTSPATMVQTTDGGNVYAFVAGLGLLRSTEDLLQWESVGKGFGDRYLLHLAIDPVNSNKLYVITNKTELLQSNDGGATWRARGAE